MNGRRVTTLGLIPYVPAAEQASLVSTFRAQCVKKNTTYYAQALGTLIISGTKLLAVLDFLVQYTLQVRDLPLS